jgi:Amt family ammonium transporter
VHAVGGTLGALLTGFLATPEVNGNLNTFLKDVVGKTLWLEQVKAIAVTLVLAIVATTVIAYIVNAVVGLRVDDETESVGLDLAEHGEEGYHEGSMGGFLTKPHSSPALGFEGMPVSSRPGNQAV